MILISKVNVNQSSSHQSTYHIRSVDKARVWKEQARTNDRNTLVCSRDILSDYRSSRITVWGVESTVGQVKRQVEVPIISFRSGKKRQGSGSVQLNVGPSATFPTFAPRADPYLHSSDICLADHKSMCSQHMLRGQASVKRAEEWRY